MDAGAVQAWTRVQSRRLFSKVVASRPGGDRAGSACILTPKRGRDSREFFGQVFSQEAACAMPTEHTT
eukprot:6711061-Lingulodinium_polyedra.AAC.1